MNERRSKWRSLSSVVFPMRDQVILRGPILQYYDEYHLEVDNYCEIPSDHSLAVIFGRDLYNSEEN